MIAVVGMAGRFPGAPDLLTFWRNLRSGTESIVTLTEDELRAAHVPDELIASPDYVRVAPRFPDVDMFDAEFFGYTAREAEIMDPQHRLFLETAWSALENAGYDSDRYAGRIGVFSGAGTNGYVSELRADRQLLETVGATALLVGNELGFLSTRVSYKLDLRGPSVSMRTACSTSLVAIHAACGSLRGGECEMALAGGVFVHSANSTGYRYQEGGFLSPDGRVRPFGAGANGTVFGSGVGAVVLKPLGSAIEDRDTIYAVVRGSAVNNDGAVKVSFTAPSVTGQSAVIRAALANADLKPDDIDYVEAHGTATTLGDPIEVQALNEAFTGARRVRIGSLKGNVGHLDAAAGMAGFLKTVLALTHGALPASINSTADNPAIDFAGGPFEVQRETTAWPRGERVRRAGVSAFGFGGTNAHVIVEEAPEPEAPAGPVRSHQVLVLSARSAEALEELTDLLTEALRRDRPALPDTAFTLGAGRRAFPFRRIVVGAGHAEIAAGLDMRDPALVKSGSPSSEPPHIVFVYSGQGSQHPGMGREIYRSEPAFRAAVDRCAELLRPHLADADIREVMFGADERIHRTAWAQPALFTLQYALTELWREWGVTPSAMVGHSIGELTAACVAGVFSLEDALTLVASRGRLMQEQPPGSMVALTIDAPTLRSHLPAALSLAAENTPTTCVVAGPPADIEAFVAQAAGRGWPAQPVTTSHAFHSAMMNPVADPLAAAVAARPRSAPRIPFTSNVTGDWITADQATDPRYWADHLLSTVRYADCVRTATEPAGAIVLEIGPGQGFASLARRNRPGLTAIASLADHAASSSAGLMTALGSLWLHGVDIDWAFVHPGRRRIPLPTYPFQRKRFWAAGNAPTERGPTRRSDPADWFHAPSWQQSPLPRGGGPDLDVPWLIFSDSDSDSDSDGVGAALAERLRAAGADVTMIAASSDLERCRAVLAGIEARTGALPTRIVHGGQIGAAADPRGGFEGLIHLGRALAEATENRPQPDLRLWVLSTGLHNVLGAEPTDPAKAMLLGPVRVLPRELPGLSVWSIDLAGPVEADLDLLWRELGHAPIGESETVAHRGRCRWVRGFMPLRLTVSGPAPLRPDGVYVITGGTGDLGLALADHLTELGAHVVLITRSGPEITGPKLAGRPGDPLVLRADIADVAQVRAAIAQVLARYGRITGVFHTAGVAGGGLVRTKDLRAADEVLRPKVAGTLALDAALDGVNVEFLALYSSNGANVGSLGQVDYCAANCFLDAYAQSRADRRVISINWGPWRETGMTVGSARAAEVLDRGMSTQEALRALTTVLAAWDGPQVVISPAPPSEILAEAARPALGPSPVVELRTRPALATELAGARTATERAIAEAWRDLLGVDGVGIHDNFFDLGGNSLIAIQLVSTINQRLASRLTLADLYGNPTVGQLAGLADPAPAPVVGPSPTDSAEDRREKLRKRQQHQERRRAGRGQR